jgi:hypothetical protein
MPESAIVEIMYINGSLVCIITDLWFLLASARRLKNLKESRRRKFFPELLVQNV